MEGSILKPFDNIGHRHVAALGAYEQTPSTPGLLSGRKSKRHDMERSIKEHTACVTLVRGGGAVVDRCGCGAMGALPLGYYSMRFTVNDQARRAVRRVQPF